MKPCVLAIDHGTQSVRALLIDADGNLLAKSQVAMDAYRTPQPGWLEIEPDAFWSALCAACQQLWPQLPVPRNSIVAMVLTTQRATTIALDANGRPLRPALVWLDQRRASRIPRLAWWWELALRAVAMRSTVRHFQHEAEANWMAEHEPGLWAGTAKFLLLSGYLHYRFTGEFVDSTASQVGYIPFDYRRACWAAPHDWKWQALPIRHSQLPQLCPVTQTIGKVSAQAAADTGIPQGLPIIAGAADKACEVLGAGCLTPDVACLSYGTAATVSITTSRYMEALPFVPPYQAALPGHYNCEIQISRGFWLVRWFKDEFGLHERQLAEKLGVTPESLFDDLVNSVPPGADGLMLQPFWNPGIKVPGPEARGAIIGFGDVHTRAHLYRAILEGLGYALREGKERLERRSGTTVQTVRVAGGGSQSDAALQITADIFNLPCERPHLYETSGLGAAMIGAVGMGLHTDFQAAAQAMTRTGKRFVPDPRHVSSYQGLYQGVYRRMYDKLRPLYHRLKETRT